MKYTISLGGSLLVPDDIDTTFVKKFTAAVLAEARRGHSFFIIAGGGRTARAYIQALRRFGRAVPSEDLDWIGIAATKMNAQLLLSVFGNAARRHLLTDPTERKTDLKKINLASGWKPGRSTDYVAVRIAKTYGIQTVINLSNIDYVYSADPRKNPGAKRFEKMTWKQYIKQFGSRWDPGANFPFDPVAAGLARREKIKVVVLNGGKLSNFKNFLVGKPFKGTVIS